MEEKNILKNILEKVEEEGLKIDFYKISLDYETGEKTLIVKTSSVSPEGIEKLNKIENKIQDWINKNWKNWFIMLIPIGES
jgi:hypothetical protein